MTKHKVLLIPGIEVTQRCQHYSHEYSICAPRMSKNPVGMDEKITTFSKRSTDRTAMKKFQAMWIAIPVICTAQKYDRSKCNCGVRKKRLFHNMHARLMPKLNSFLLTSRELYQIILWLNVLLIFIRVYLLRKATLHYICHELSKQPS